MPILRSHVTIPATSGIAKDAYTNSWSFFCASGTELATHNLARVKLTAFYNAWDTYRGMNGNWAAATMTTYNWADTRPRAPVKSEVMGLTATAAASQMPGEVSLCLSFAAAPSSGLPQARRRGRIYLGPLAAVAADSSTGRPATSFVTAVRNAANTLLTGITADGTYTWVVHSHTTGAVPGTYSEAGSSVTVSQGWVDNAWDTQRRRGLAPTSRSTY